MQERRLRLGDVLDDYCPREKRLTNHVIVALVGDEVRTTRCATCDFEHVYKAGKVPVRRKKASPQATLYKTVLDNITGRDAETGEPVAPVSATVDAPASPPRVVPSAVAAGGPTPSEPPGPGAPTRPAAAVPAEATLPVTADDDQHGEPVRPEEPVHRHTLIRATLPKIDGQVPERKPADFTLWNVSRQPQGRRGRPRPAQPSGPLTWNGYSPYANGHPSGKNPQQGQQGGQPGRSRSNQRRGR